MTAPVTDVLLNLVASPTPGSGSRIAATWWTTPGILDRALEILRAHDLFPDLAIAQRSGRKKRWSFRGLEDLLAIAHEWKAGYYELTPGEPGGPWSLRLDLDKASFGIHLSLGGSALDARREVLTTRAAEAAVAVATAIHPDWALTPGALFSDGFAFPRIRPPILHATFLVGAIVNVVDLHHYRTLFESGYGSQEAVTEMETPTRVALPAGVSLFRGDDCYAVRWVESLIDPVAVQRQLSAQESWVAQHLDATREPYFNAAGDRLVVGQLVPTPPFTLYDPSQQLACLAVGAWSDGRVDDADEQTLAALRRAPPLPIARLAAIVQSREVAVAVSQRLLEAGADTVLYPSDDGRQLWDLWPPGVWRAP